MKNLKQLFSIFILLFLMNNVSAQFGNQGMGGGAFGGQGMGGGRINQQQNQIPQTPSKPEEESEKSKKERLDKIVAKLKTDLTLDDLQVFAVQGVVGESMKKQAALFKKEMPENDKIAEMQALSETTDRKVSEFLNKEQKKKYNEMTAERKEKLQELMERRR